MRTLKRINIGKKYFISNLNDVMIFKDIDEMNYSALWSVDSQSYGDFPQHRHKYSDGMKFFKFNEYEFKKIRDYHINNRKFRIDYKWLEITFNLSDFKYD